MFFRPIFVPRLPENILLNQIVFLSVKLNYYRRDVIYLFSECQNKKTKAVHLTDPIGRTRRRSHLRQDEICDLIDSSKSMVGLQAIVSIVQTSNLAW